MQDLPWKICQYFFTEECPYQSEISKAILIPQMLGPTEMERIRRLCANCEKCGKEKRTSLRIKKPLRVAVVSSDLKRNIEGSIVDISSTGALVELDVWFEVKIGETLELKIYSSAQDRQAQVSLAGQQCVVKRLSEENRRLAVQFIRT